MPRTPIVVAAFFRRALLDAASQRAAGLVQLVGALGALSGVLFLSRLIDATPNPLFASYGSYAGFLLVGLVAAELQRAVSVALTTRIREAQLQGTLEAMLATPTPIWLILLGLALPELGATLLRATMQIAFGILLFGISFAHADWGATAATLAMTLFAFATLGVLGAALTLRLRRADPLTPLLTGVSMVLSSVLYPLSVLPEWLRPIGEWMPVTPALEALRGATLAGQKLSAIGLPLGKLALFFLLLAPTSAWLFAGALRRARTDGSLATY